MNWSAIALGAAGLAVADAVLSKKGGAENVAGIGTSAAGVVSDFLSVTVPGLPAKTTTNAVTTSATADVVTATTALAPANAAGLRATQ